jgi:hypothetical protein
MTNSFTQRHVEGIPLKDLTPHQFLTLAVEATKLLGWSIRGLSKTWLTAYTNNNFLQGNSEIKLNVFENRATLLSQSGNLVTVELGRDRLNFKNFLDKFNNLKRGGVTAGEISLNRLNVQPGLVLAGAMSGDNKVS